MVEKSVKILHVVGGVDHRGGLMSVVVGLASASSPQVHCLVWKHREFQPAPGPVHYVCGGLTRYPFRSLIGDLLGSVREVLPLWAWVRRNPGAILHAHTRLGHFASALVSRLTGSPLILHFHALSRRTWVYHALRRWARAEIVFNSRKTYERFGWRLDAPLIVMPPITWPTAPPPRSSGPVRFVMAGAFVRLKNLHLVLEAFKRLAEDNPTIELLIYGISPAAMEPAYQGKMISAAQACERVTLAPYDPQWSTHLTENDIFVHAAALESFGIVILEAFARGCRVVVPRGTFVDDLPDAHARSVGVHRVEELDVLGFSEAMKQAMQIQAPSDVLWKQRKSYEELFSYETALERLLPLYATLAQPGASNTPRYDTGCKGSSPKSL